MSTNIYGTGLQFPFHFEQRSGGASISTATSRDHTHIHESIRQILGTRVGERFMSPDFGSRLHMLVFEGNGPILHGLVRHYVTDALEKWEPRIRVEEVVVAPTINDIDGNFLPVHIRYRLISTQVDGNMVYPFYLESASAAA